MQRGDLDRFRDRVSFRSNAWRGESWRCQSFTTQFRSSVTIQNEINHPVETRKSQFSFGSDVFFRLSSSRQPAAWRAPFASLLPASECKYVFCFLLLP